VTTTLYAVLRFLRHSRGLEIAHAATSADDIPAANYRQPELEGPHAYVQNRLCAFSRRHPRDYLPRDVFGQDGGCCSDDLLL
jgi:hypothetical protein